MSNIEETPSNTSDIKPDISSTANPALDTMESLIEEFSPKEILERGEIVDGTVINIQDNGLVIDLGQKSEGFVPKNEMRSLTNPEIYEKGKSLITYVIFPETQDFLRNKLDENKNILLEGAQGSLLDIDHGSYPFVTSSNSTIGGALTGTGLVPSDIKNTIGIFKAYSTRVGEGPFPSEIDKSDIVAKHLLEKGHEFGTTTGRERRCGWFDIQSAKHSIMTNGFNKIAIMKLDVLDGLDEIKVLNDSYNNEYDVLPGWNDSTFGATNYKDLPTNAKIYLNYLEEKIKVKIYMISTGPERDQTIII